jgi:simple sugar transport system ATP-binding protein
LEEAIRGMRAVQEGQVLLGGQDVTHQAPAAIVKAGLGHVPSDRYQMGLVGDFSVAENLVLTTVEQPPFTQRRLLRLDAIRTHAAKLVAAFDIRTSGIDSAASTLSGGNAQKVVLARELAPQPQLLLVSQPTRGVDIGAIELVHRELVRQRDAGMAILLISTELDEILQLSDRIVVLYEGKIVGELQAEGADVDRLGLMMAGAEMGIDDTPVVEGYGNEVK